MRGEKREEEGRTNEESELESNAESKSASTGQHDRFIEGECALLVIPIYC